MFISWSLNPSIRLISWFICLLNPSILLLEPGPCEQAEMVWSAFHQGGVTGGWQKVQHLLWVLTVQWLRWGYWCYRNLIDWYAALHSLVICTVLFFSYLSHPVGPSVDQAGVTMVDSIKVYIKTKEAFGWPEDQEDYPESSVNKVTSSSVVGMPGDIDGLSAMPLPLTSIDRLLASSLEVLDGCFAASPNTDEKVPNSICFLGFLRC